jgi:putative DNA primase/helicase
MLGRMHIIEWAELDSMRRARDSQSTKAFLTSRADTFRPPYGRNTVTIPRCCVIVGTTNDEGFLSDPTGSRRFWPVKVKGVDVEWVKVHRDQLWAEAVIAFGAGEIHYIEAEHTEALTAHAAKFEQHDPWATLIHEHHESVKGGQPDYTTGELLDDAIKKPTGQWTLGDQMRVGRVCTTLLGWKRVMGRRAGRRVWVYRIPDRTPGQEG